MKNGFISAGGRRNRRENRAHKIESKKFKAPNGIYFGGFDHGILKQHANENDRSLAWHFAHTFQLKIGRNYRALDASEDLGHDFSISRKIDRSRSPVLMRNAFREKPFSFDLNAAVA